MSANRGHRRRGDKKGKGEEERDPYSALEKIVPGSAQNIDRALKWVLLRLKGEGAMPLESLIQEGEEEKFGKETLITAVRKLDGDGYVTMPDPSHVALVAVERRRKGVFRVRVERTYHGGATLLINDRFRARLSPEDFPASTSLIRKGGRFTAMGSLYRDEDNKLCLRVDNVLP